MGTLKTPISPRDATAWRSGPQAGDLPYWKYAYNLEGPETFATVAAKFAGALVANKTLTVPLTLSWQEIVQFNYGTDDPGEINWYMQAFNGSTKVNAAGDFVFDASDPYPFIYIPGTSLTAASAVVVPPGDKRSVLALPPPSSQFTRTAVGRFKDIDVMKTGFLRRSDIQTNLTSSSFQGTDGAMLATLWYKYSDLEDFSNDELGPETNGVTRADLVALDRLLATSPSDAAKSVINSFDYMKTKITLAGSALYATDPVEPLKVCQGLVGDCWFLAALVGLKTRANPTVRGMIVDKGKSFVVTFPGDAQSPVTVPRPTDAQTAIVAGSHGNGLWLTILELAVGFRKELSNPIAGVDTGAQDGDGIELLTNHSTDTDYLSLHKDATTRAKLSKTLGADKAVVAGIRSELAGSDLRHDKWPMGHAYTVLAFDATADTITVRNPWGDLSGKWKSTGEVIAMSEFFRNWTDVAYEE